MYKILFITLIVLSVSIRAQPEAETGFVELGAAAPAPAKPAAVPAKPVAAPSANVPAKPVAAPAAKPAAKAAAPAAKPAAPAVKPAVPVQGTSSKNVDKSAPVVQPLSSQQKVAPRTGVNAKTGSVKTRKCHNRFDYSGFQVNVDCVVCQRGTHESNGKCVSNAVGCTKKVLVTRTDKAKVTIGGNCVKCSFWQWTTVSDVQGNYCVNRWWMWVIIFFSGLVILALFVSAITFFACCNDCCSKKQSSKSSKGKGGEVVVQNKKPTDKKAKSSSGCCGGSDKKKVKKEESYDKGYSKPGFCDCMCLANSCGGCLGACGCTCSKCCRKQGKYVSGYGLNDRF